VKGLLAAMAAALIVSATFSDFVNFRCGYGFLQIDFSHYLATIVFKTMAVFRRLWNKEYTCLAMMRLS
jgi:hypothetical protein